MPVLHTERLVLHPLSAELARAALDGTALPAAPGFPSTDDAGLLEMLALAPDTAGHVYLLEHDGAMIGTLGGCGQLDPDGRQEISYGLVPQARRRGLATEAVAALCAVLEREPGVREICAQVEPGNAPSLRLLHRLAFDQAASSCTGHLLFVRAAPGRPPARLRGRHVC